MCIEVFETDVGAANFALLRPVSAMLVVFFDLDFGNVDHAVHAFDWPEFAFCQMSLEGVLWEGSLAVFAVDLFR